MIDCTDEQLMEEVRRRGFVIRDAQIGRKWVGLTDGEFRAIGQRFENDNGHVQAWMSFARHIQFALKEKNT